MIGIDLMHPPGCQMSNCFWAAFTQHATRFSSKASAHIIVFTVDRQLPISPDRASKGLLIDLHQPSIRIDRLGNSRQRRECRAGHTRWMVATGARLVGPLAVVVSKIRLGERRRPPRACLADTPASTPDLSMQPDRGTGIDKVGDLDHMLSLAFRISRHLTSIFEIKLDFLPRLPRFQWLGLLARIQGNTARLAHNFPNRRLGVWQAQAGIFQSRIAVQGVQDRFWTGDAVQVLGAHGLRNEVVAASI